jgi:uncharacterized membrane protein
MLPANDWRSGHGPRQSLGLPSQQWYRRGRLWVALTTGATIAVLAGVALLMIDNCFITADTLVPPKYLGSPDTARALLSVTATSIATLTALVLTIVTVVVQLASDKYSHRAARTFLQHRHSHLTLGVFVGTFTFAVLALLGLDATIEDSIVVGLTIPAAFGLAVITIGIFVSYIVHAVRGTSIFTRIGTDTREEVERLYPDRFDDETTETGVNLPDEPKAVIDAPRPGVVYEMDIAGLVEWAAAADATVVIRPAVGDFIPGDSPMIDL